MVNKRRGQKRKRPSDPPSPSPSSADPAASSLPHSLRSIAITHPSHLPPTMLKYWNNRFTLFSLFAQGILLDEQSWYSVTPECIAHRIAVRCRCDTVLDPFCGAGGNAIQLALTCRRVVAIDVDPNKVRLARHNAGVYGVADRILFLVGDYRDFVRDVRAWRASDGRGETDPQQQRQQRRHHYSTSANDEPARQAATGRSDPDPDAAWPATVLSSGEKWHTAETLDYDVVFLSPPWGGVDYLDPQKMAASSSSSSLSTAAAATDAETDTGYTDLYPLRLLQPLPAHELYALTTHLTNDIALYLPRNTDLHDLASLVERPLAGPDPPPGDEADGTDARIKVEEQYLGAKLSALTCYFGRLASEWDDETDTWKSVEGTD